MTTQIVAGKGSFTALMGATKAFITAHPIGMAMLAGGVIGVVSYKTISGRLSARKDRKALAAIQDSAAAQAT
jgi:hypothetical protein